MARDFSVSLFLNHGNHMVPETIVTVKSWGLECADFFNYKGVHYLVVVL